MPRLCLLLTALVVCAFAEPGGDTFQASTHVRIRIAMESNRGCDPHTHVSLIDNSTPAIVEGFANSDCTVDFFGVSPGNYSVVVTGPGIVGSENREYEIDNRRVQDLDVRVRTSGESKSEHTDSAMVATTNLAVPRGAKKKFESAGQSIAKNDLPKALEQLRKAIDIYPTYADAYNDLGVVYRRLGDMAKSREALQEALRLNDRLAPAYANLARLEIADRNYPAAENLLEQATATGLDDTPTLMLLASVQLLTQHYDQVVTNCHRVHATPQVPHAVAHYMAATAYEHENRPAEALAELRTFLSEEQTGTRADAARKEISALQNAVQASR